MLMVNGCTANNKCPEVKGYGHLRLQQLLLIKSQVSYIRGVCLKRKLRYIEKAEVTSY